MQRRLKPSRTDGWCWCRIGRFTTCHSSRSGGNSSIAAVRGRILYDFGGSACDGYSLTFRQVSELSSSEGKQSTSDLRSTTWEGADAKRFKFTSQNFVDGNLVDAVDGNADHDGK